MTTSGNLLAVSMGTAILLKSYSPAEFILSGR